LSKIMSKQTYWEKLQHPLWQQRRLEAMKKADFKCEQCDSKDTQLNVHHLYYVSKRDPWQYPDWALKCLCKDCHNSTHNPDPDDTEDGYPRLPFEDMFGFLEGSTDVYCETWDLCTQFAMLRNSKPEKLREFNTALLYFAHETRIKMEEGLL